MSDNLPRSGKLTHWYVFMKDRSTARAEGRSDE
jgi:hypothetical protein